MTTYQHIIKELSAGIKGDILSDDGQLGLYATDASVYEIKPIVVVLPKDESDVLLAVKIADKYKIALLPRGGGTSLSGQTIAEAMVLDFSKYMHNVLEINVEERWAKVQPGVVRDELNDVLKKNKLHYAPDPATSNRAVIGGMVANNSSGTKSLIYGKAVDHILEMKVVLADGTILILNELSEEEWQLKTALNNREGEIYRRFRALVFENSEEIIARFPKTMRRTQGYNLDEFAGKERWNLGKIICGSEGTLAIILEIKINLEPLPTARCLCAVHFHDFLESIRATEHILKFNPTAVELVDKSVLDMARENYSTAPQTWFLQGDPEAILSVEFEGDNLDICLENARLMTQNMLELGFGYAFPIFTDIAQINDVLTVRKKGLGLVMGVKSNRKYLSFIEDAAIPVPQLADYMAEVLALCKRHGTDVSAYAHASVGVIHVKPFLDLRLAEDIEKYKAISEETFLLVQKYGGSWSSEHGDGLARSAYLERYFGTKIYGALKEVKHIFDPDNRMHPGNIIDAPPIDSHLRYGADYQDLPSENFFQYREDGSFAAHVHLCTGVGECRKKTGGTMCPSYKATLDEIHSTRGRANALRLAISGQLPTTGKNWLAEPFLKEALDLCLSCKACKSECPSNVDMARMKSEVLQNQYDTHGIPLRDKFVRDSSKWAKRLSGPFAPLVNGVQGTGLFKWALAHFVGMTSERRLPNYAAEPFYKWFGRRASERQTSTRSHTKTVALFADTYLNYHETSIGKSAVALLEGLGYEVLLANAGCCQRPKISHGFLRDAKKEGEKTARNLDVFSQKNIPVLVCEPSCSSALTDDLPDLLDDEKLGRRLQENVMPIEVFLQKEITAGRLEKPIFSSEKSIFIHGHCHQKALYGTEAMKAVLGKVKGLKVTEADTGCCGMAGSFGYEKEHFEISKKVGELALLPALEKLSEGTTIVANGFSCRHQIADFSGKKAFHWVEILKTNAQV